MRILIVENQKDLHDNLLWTTKSMGFSVDVVPTALQGLKHLKDAHYDLMILDLGLPDSAAINVLRRIRRQQNDVSILVLTAHEDIESKVEIFKAGADDYLTTPFAPTELAARIQALLRRTRASEEAFLRVSDLELNRLTRQVRRGGKRIDLSPKEYALLEHLLLNAGRPMTRSLLVEKSWGQSFDGLTNVVDVYIRHLRRKMDESYEPKLIRTIRGLGYILDLEVIP
jgi:DNA-binding response OmpR family regulator